MKLKTILIAMVFVSAITTKAQDVNWQARVGGGVTCLMGGVSNINERTGFHIGGGADIGLSKNGVFRLQPELRFERNGWQFDGYYGSEQIMEAHFKTRLDYLKLPVMVAARLRLSNQCFITFKTINISNNISYSLSKFFRLFLGRNIIFSKKTHLTNETFNFTNKSGISR